jgi:nitroreductase
MNSSLDLIFARRSIRVFRPGEVSPKTVKTILEAAMAAPSAVAKDPWRFVVVRQQDRLEEITEGLPNGKMLASAAVGIFVCGDMEAVHDRQLSYLLQDCSAAIENLLIAVHGLGLGAVWLGIHPREDRVQSVARILRLPASIIPVAGIAIGHRGEEKEARTRFREEYVHYETW